ncbi:DUF4133 domain-containing protein [Chitinophaga niabensis]|uniref:DUF4133 domain-containing protein n=1 Tax=Chitinophaga niabensis TaxID=536979 RepID=A0A1N6E4G9_9BACT|nr:DUF4133 domain-containing protein [Chitinophaga niabensis]SIN77899.1 protein of unknown function [Chitinophaga niabensis]
MSSVYTINKGINKSIEFKGLKAQYIWYFGGVVMLLFLLYTIMYFIGLNSYIAMGIIVIAGTGLVLKVYALSNKYGEFGMMKAMAKKMVPKVIKSYSRAVFRNLIVQNKK